MTLETMALSVHGVDFRLAIPPDSPNALHFREAYQRNGQYEAVMTAIVARLLRAHDRPVFADVGAFIGFYACYARALLGGRGQAFAVESNPAYAAVVEAALKLNGFTDVPVYQAALWDREQALWADGVTLHDGSAQAQQPFRLPEHTGGRRPDRSTAEGQPVQLQSTTMDLLCRRNQLAPTHVKMDVHGTEGKILKGMQKTLSGPVQFLLLELHNNAYLRKYAPDVSRMQILDLLEDAGFTNHFVAGHRYTWSDGLKVFEDCGRFSYRPLTRATRDLLLFDRHADIFVLAAKQPLEPILGASMDDPSLE